MTAPRIPPLPRATRALLSRERAFGADPSLRQRVLERARAELEGRRSRVELSRASNRPLYPSWRLGRNLLLVAATLALASLAAAGARLYALEPVAPPVEPPALSIPPVSDEIQPAARVLVSSPEAAATAVRTIEPQRTPTAASEPTRASGPSSYPFELRLLEPARRDIARSNFSAALSSIARHQREFPRGQLVEEREALRVRALWGMGARSEAQSAALLFRKRYPHSGLLSWMKPATLTP